ncbi:hypothetical protein THRCLA_20937, partial [Thraustotheca clavata]
MPTTAPEHSPVIPCDELLPLESFVPLTERSACTVCSHKFSVFRQKHNCSWCGEVVCGSCIVPRLAKAN